MITGHQFLDTYFHNGGNFLDTSTNYHDGEVEVSSSRELDGSQLTEVDRLKRSLASGWQRDGTETN